MSGPILATKLFITPPRSSIVLRPRLSERLNEGLSTKRRLTLISAPAGFGKTTLVSEWIARCGRPVAWLSLDVGDNDSARFLTYLVTALQTIASMVGEGILFSLQSPQLPPIESILTTLLNEIADISDNFILVLEDYHVIDSEPIDHALTFILDHLPQQMHLVITTREDPQLPLARYRARGQLTELRSADLRFTPVEAADFLNQVMGLNLSAEEVTALETRTEGWIAGLQLAAISMQGHQDTPSFIKSFTASHHFVMDFLIEEVLQQQTEDIQTFLLRTSILDRMCGPLCDAVLGSPSATGQETLEYLEHANLFIVPLDNERRWYRYHHLFAELLRLRLGKTEEFAEFHIRASQWYEENGLDLEAFQHAAEANDIERAERIIESKGIPLHFRGAVASVLNWLTSLPKTVLDARPSLGVMYAKLSLNIGQRTGVEEKLQAAEAVLQVVDPDHKQRDLIGQIAATRAIFALALYQAEAIITHARLALEYLDFDNPYRIKVMWALGFAYQLQGNRPLARKTYTEAIAISQASGNIYYTILATSGLGDVQVFENQLYQAAETYRHVLQLHGDDPQPIAGEDHLGLARIYYEWNDLDTAEYHAQQSCQLERMYEPVIDRLIISEVFLARLKLARGDVAGAAAILADAEQSVSQNNFVHRISEVAAAQVLVLLRQGDLSKAAYLAQTHDLPFSQARVHLAQGDPSAALALLEPLSRENEAKGWVDEQLKVMVLRAVAFYAHGEKNHAVQLLGEALTLAKPGGFIRLFIDEGKPMGQLLREAASQRIMPDYIGKLLAAFEAEKKPKLPPAQPLIEPLSERELEVLKLLRTDLSGPEIARELTVSLSTLRTHTQRIFAKLGVNNRRAAVRRAEELDLL
jgi:LuxR family transcriptional regulator, maltose regulon positive regulatory protein